MPIRSNLLAFALKAFAALYQGKQLVSHPYATLVTWYLESVAEGQIKRLVVTLPPRHLKTFLASICLAAWILAHNPSAKILVISYGQELADKIAFAIRAILQSDPAERVVLQGLQDADCEEPQSANGLRHHHRRRRRSPLGLDRGWGDRDPVECVMKDALPLAPARCDFY
jgi:hypothetical protein